MTDTAPRFQFTVGDFFIAIVSLAFPVAFAANLDRDLYLPSDLNALWVLILVTGLPGFLYALHFRRNWQSRSPWFVPPFLFCGWSLLMLFFASEVPPLIVTGLSFYPALCLGIALTAYCKRTLAPNWYLIGICALAPMLAFSYAINARIQEAYLAKRERMAAATCNTIAEAQEKFHRTDYDKDGKLEYSPDVRGLYETKPGTADLNLIPLALARADISHSSPRPYRGYYYRILHAQGARMPGGAKSWIDNSGNLRAYAVIAYPSDYGITGRNTFLISTTVFMIQEDYGPRTRTIAEEMKEYNPDLSNWMRPQ